MRTNTTASIYGPTGIRTVGDKLDCLALVFDFQAPELNDYRVRFLRNVDEDEMVTVGDSAKEISAYGFRVRTNKCHFVMIQLTYFGNVNTADGRRPDPKKIDTITQVAKPKDTAQVRSYLGLINHYGTFASGIMLGLLKPSHAPESEPDIADLVLY
ncbi:unnamed protein product [Haemonchus placei]|uniref:Reverse transcriptase domain-containing protein n=1 Tax=Haemonchus placei TaxID=6290 RepID=A0A0N4VRV4_HAEPC|nr:unnamed protein product [Haemonchus placei]